TILLAATAPSLPTPFPPLSPLVSFTTPPTSYIYTLSLHDALPIFQPFRAESRELYGLAGPVGGFDDHGFPPQCILGHRIIQLRRSEEHTSELQSPYDLVCRLLLEKKKTDKRQSETLCKM